MLLALNPLIGRRPFISNWHCPDINFPMKQIRIKDRVALLDGREATVVDVITVSQVTVFKVQVIARRRDIEYFDESKIRLKKQHLHNLLRDLFSQVMTRNKRIQKIMS